MPGAWAEGLRALLGVVPRDDREGCLQDIHWYDGAWGYFPTYTLGAMIAAQLFEAARGAIPELMAAIAARRLRAALRLAAARGAQQGSLLSTAELVEKRHRRARSAPAAFERHLRRRYLGASNEPEIDGVDRGQRIAALSQPR